MTYSLTKLAFSAALGLAFIFTVSCGEHSFEELLGLYSSSSSVGSSSSSVGGSNPIGSSSSRASVGSSSSVGGGGNFGYGSLSYDGKTYKTVKIGTQTWMAENLNYNASGSVCYDNDPANCNKYGRLYDWATAMNLDASCNSSTCYSQINAKHKGICPSDWHIPSDEEWDLLMTAVGGSSTASKYLKATSGWSRNGNGEDKYGFAALPGGFGGSGGNFYNVGIGGYWWSASEFDAGKAYGRRMDYSNEDVFWDNDDSKDFLFSVRCLQN